MDSRSHATKHATPESIGADRIATFCDDTQAARADIVTRRTDPADAPTAAAITAADGTLLIDAPIIPVGGVMCHLGCACWLNWLYTEMAPNRNGSSEPGITE